MNDTPEMQEARLRASKSIFKILHGESYEDALKVLIVTIVTLIRLLPEAKRTDVLASVLVTLADTFHDTQQKDKENV